ncbi:hypothetical protein JL49_12020, partial [Pseudoalteromonas luteoviolacea]
GTLNGSTYTTGSVTSNCQINAQFEPIKYSITASASLGGSIAPANQLVNHGDVVSLTVSAKSGYSIDSVKGCSGSLNGSVFTTGVITGDCGIEANFKLNQYTIEVSAGEGGMVSPPSQMVNHGGSVDFTITPEQGRNIASVVGCNGVLNGNVYTVQNVTSACSIAVRFNRDSFIVSGSTGEGGRLTPATQTVTYGNSTTLNALPDEGYRIKSIIGCEGTLNGNTYTTGSVTSSCQVSAQFEPIQYTVAASASVGGGISPASQLVNHGNTANITVVEDSGYSIDSVTGCAGTLNGGIFTTSAITQNCTVQATFKLNEYTIQVNAGEGGIVSPLNKVVNHGGSAD